MFLFTDWPVDRWRAEGFGWGWGGGSAFHGLRLSDQERDGDSIQPRTHHLGSPALPGLMLFSLCPHRIPSSCMKLGPKKSDYVLQVCGSSFFDHVPQ